MRGNTHKSASDKLKKLLARSPKKRIVIGAGGRHDPGWIPTEKDVLNVLSLSDWNRFFEPDSIDALLAEHVWEHLTSEEGVIAAGMCFKYLKPGGYVRVAVPDGRHPDPVYIDAVKAGGSGRDAHDHKHLYTCDTLKKVFESAGFKVTPYEYFDDAGNFNYRYWDPEDGKIYRSKEYDRRNKDGTLNYTSIILDAVKEESQDILNHNRAGWEQAAPSYSVGTALPEYGPLAPTEDMLQMLDPVKDAAAIELGCGGGHSLLYLAEHEAREVWGVDISEAQISFARDLLRDQHAIVRLFQSPMEINPGVPAGYFDLVLSIYALGCTSDLTQTFKLAAGYLKPGGCFIFSDEHPVYSCLTYENERLIFQEPYANEDFYRNEIEENVKVIIKKRMLSTFINTLIEAGLELEQLIEGEINYDVAKKKHGDPGQWYSVQRAKFIPTTFIIKARKPYN